MLTWQPPPIRITLQPGMGYDEVSEEFRHKTYEASCDGISSKLKTYLLNQWDFIHNYCILKEKLKAVDPALVRMGVIEGHIYQVLYLRFESRGG